MKIILKSLLTLLIGTMSVTFIQHKLCAMEGHAEAPAARPEVKSQLEKQIESGSREEVQKELDT